ncbi:YitT family protein [Anaerovoracaceae bacterium 41-7]|uniref:YitT family protein n=1 Tax=Anaerotruncus colihominis TaxID=169435 RepID=A0A845QMS0_9FIRM|nr:MULTISPECIES: YitT family protein [Anaerotruncus]NBH62936.1 YitT family protein [Anaerotruncus colihominis]NCF03590.1 YitT family protein [Anaerotruncus sp. 80]
MKETVKEKLINFIFLLIACAVGAFATTAVMIPNGLTSGGLTGLVRILQNYVDINFSLAYYAGAFLILIVVLVTLGLQEAKKVLAVTILYPAVMFVMELFDFQLLEEKDIILAAIFCGVFSGVCNGIVFWRGYAFCGTESIATILKKKLMPQVDLSKILLALDAAIIIISAFIFGRNIALYALVTQFIASKMVDFIMYGFETKIVQVNILTTKPDETIAFVMRDLNRGVSSRTAVGEFTGQSKKELVVLCSPRESMILKRFLASVDPAAFVTVLHVDTVWGSGKGFTEINKD